MIIITVKPLNKKKQRLLSECQCSEVIEAISCRVLNFYLEYAQTITTPILEPMCGSGRFLIPMLEQGFNIEGFDASPHNCSTDWGVA